MNIIEIFPISQFGYQFIDAKFIPEGLDEYYLRNIQNPSTQHYKPLTQLQKQQLISNGNYAVNWEEVKVMEGFEPNLVKNCKFYGLVRIGAMQAAYKEFHNFKMAIGLYNSTIISCDIGTDVCIDNVHYLSHYIIDDNVMIANVHELATTDYAKFGNGVLKEDEAESVRTWIEVCNENGGRSILPFNGMLAGDAFLWSKYRDDEALMQRFVQLTDNLFDKKRGYYGRVGERSVLKNCGIIKDVWIGTDAYIKGANKIKNVTINSDAARHSQIGEGCELVNGIVGFGCRIFYGVKAVRFVVSSHSQLKYGARLINSYLGNNSTISCCEVLNSLIFPSHEQHHNNSFLCAATVMGQSNMAAGATIGSNHNSRSADGEIIAGRGFWPGLCVSLKHNSVFASFTIIAKGDFPAEVQIPIPFSLVSLDACTGSILVMPAYWFMYNMYAMERNAWKTKARDRRTEKLQLIEYNYLAPDTINEIFDGLKILKSLSVNEDGSASVPHWVNGKHGALIVKVPEAINIFNELIVYYATCQFLKIITEQSIPNFAAFKKQLHAKISRSKWVNVGGQLIRKSKIEKLKQEIKTGLINSWQEVHDAYKEQGNLYENDKLTHAYTSILEIKHITGAQFTETVLKETLTAALATKTWMCKGIYQSRAKDYSNPFRKMVYDTNEEMNKVLGKLEDNSFIQEQAASLHSMSEEINAVLKSFKL